jgi:hypothetical protein
MTYFHMYAKNQEDNNDSYYQEAIIDVDIENIL